MKILFSYLQQQWKYVTLALLLGIVNNVFSLLDPYIYRLIIDNYATQHEKYTPTQFFSGVLWLLGGVVLVAMISRIAKNFQDYFVNVVVQKVGTHIYTDGIRHAIKLPFQDFEDRRSGETLGILQKVRTDTERLVNSFVNIIFAAMVAIVFVTIYSIQVYWLVAPIYLATIPLIMFVSLSLTKRIKKVQQKIVGETTNLAGSTTESLRNIELVKALGLSDQEIARLNAVTNRILGLELEKVKYVRTMSFVQGTFVNLIRTGMALLFFYLIYQGKMSVGQYFSLFMYSFYIFGALQEIGSFIHIYREAQVSFQNFGNLLALPLEPKPTEPKPIGVLSKLQFDDVNFQHQAANRRAVSHISFSINKGQTIAFVGPSGSGKTTLIKLLLGLYRPQQGNITYNGIGYNQIDMDLLREQIGVVSQDTQLFSGTLRDNLLFVQPNATDAQMIQVLQQAACNSILNRTDKGLDTIIGEGGIKVSGGEKQRISIARALLRNPTLLVFDEATAALDSLTEKEISETIRQVSSDHQHLTIMIAHRLSTIMHADIIYVMEKSYVIEHGTHDQLIAQGGLYAAMWRQQVGEGELIG